MYYIYYGGHQMAFNTYENLKYPDYFPSDCPPEDCEIKKVNVYRLCRSKSIVDENDFISYYEKNPDKYKSQILAYGISVFSCIEGCRNALSKWPALRKQYKGYSCGQTFICTGAIMETSNKGNAFHCTWWLYDGVKPHRFFKICNIE